MTFILFIIILGAIILVHEFGHFIFAKWSGTYVYEFSLGMGPKLISKKIKETEYSIRLIPLGGFVSLAGEDVLEDEKIPEEKRMYTKSFLQRFAILFFGAGNNFIFAIIILFISALIYGSVSSKPIVGSVVDGYPAYNAGLEEGDYLLKIDNEKVLSWESAMLTLSLNDGSPVTFEVKDTNGKIKNITITPVKEANENGEETYKFGFSTSGVKEKGLITSLKYAFTKTGSLFVLMWDTLKYLFTGVVGVGDLSGPVGIYSIVGQQAKLGIENILYLVAFLSINVGVINLIPFPAFDGGRILFLILEKLTNNKIPKKTEAVVNTVGFFILILLMIYVTIQDVIRLF